jgi:hypothetical protein
MSKRSSKVCSCNICLFVGSTQDSDLVCRVSLCLYSLYSPSGFYQYMVALVQKKKKLVYNNITVLNS